jgi:hypothetical protein
MSDRIFSSLWRSHSNPVLLSHILHLEAEPQYSRYSRSQVQPGNEIREVLPPVVQDVSYTTVGIAVGG